MNKNRKEGGSVENASKEVVKIGCFAEKKRALREKRTILEKIVDFSMEVTVCRLP